jgi:hypothetical protein
MRATDPRRGYLFPERRGGSKAEAGFEKRRKQIAGRTLETQDGQGREGRASQRQEPIQASQPRWEGYGNMLICGRSEV